MDDLKSKVEDLAKMLSEGKLLEAFEKYYGENVTMQENEEAPRVGKEANRKAEEAFVGGLTEFRSLKIIGMAIGENYSTLEYSLDVTHKDWGVISKTQVATQVWENGQIVKEKFYYNNAK
ncbi:nuclear transport factor 2 family protein [Patescibacteria group bacterium]|nr:nuclear transport factor 2 family protein [Patescibacteria group bacterium]